MQFHLGDKLVKQSSQLEEPITSSGPWTFIVQTVYIGMLSNVFETNIKIENALPMESSFYVKDLFQDG